MRRTALAALALLTAAAPAAARGVLTPPTPPMRAVPYSDLDLQDPRDAATMLNRIHKAAVEVCRVPGGNRAREVEDFVVCHAASVQRAVRELDARLVTAAYENPTTRRRLARVD